MVDREAIAEIVNEIVEEAQAEVDEEEEPDVQVS
jgi:hypothetical protein